MLFLYPDSVKIKIAKKDYYEGVSLFIIDRVFRYENKITEEDWGLFETFFKNLVEPNLKDIIIGEPEKLRKINQLISPFLQFSNIFLEGIKDIFKYNLFINKANTRYDAYQLAEALDIRTCPYCNRNYTSTVITKKGEKITRPQFDHYFDKADNPLLALSFYNLIPSCSVCNSSVKGAAKFDLSSHLHPYLDDSVDKIRFTYKYSNQTKSGLEVIVKTKELSKEKKTVKEFAVEEIYNSHTGELLELLRTRQYFSEKYLEILKTNLLRGVIVSQEDLYRIAFGVELNPENFINRPFSKFKKDILTELGVV